MRRIIYIVEDTIITNADTVLSKEQRNAQGRAQGFDFLALGTRISAQGIHRLFYFLQRSTVKPGEFLLETLLYCRAGKAHLVRGHIRS